MDLRPVLHSSFLSLIPLIHFLSALFPVTRLNRAICTFNSTSFRLSLMVLLTFFCILQAYNISFTSFSISSSSFFSALCCNAVSLISSQYFWSAAAAVALLKALTALSILLLLPFLCFSFDGTWRNTST